MATKGTPEPNRGSRFSDKLYDEHFRSAVWVGAASAVVFFLGTRLLLSLFLVGGAGGRWDTLIIMVLAAAVGVIAGRKRYRGEI